MTQPLVSRPPTAGARAALVSGRVGSTLLRLAAPMVVGIGAIMFFQIADTHFVGQLGPRQLAAMSFSFPVHRQLARQELALGEIRAAAHPG